MDKERIEGGEEQEVEEGKGICWYRQAYCLHDAYKILARKFAQKLHCITLAAVHFDVSNFAVSHYLTITLSLNPNNKP